VDPLDLLDPDPHDLGLHVLHNLLDFLRKLMHPRPHHVSGAKVTRMNRNFRIAIGRDLQLPTLVTPDSP